MSDKETSNLPSGWGDEPAEGRNEQRGENGVEEASHASGVDDMDDNHGPKDGVTFNWVNLIIGVVVVLCFSDGANGLFSGDWVFYPCLAIAVVIHELGHVVMGKACGCFIKEMQVFFLSFISYKPKVRDGGSSWRDIKWSLGILPLGGVTIFKSREAKTKGEAEDLGTEGLGTGSMEMGMTPATSPFIEDKPAWQRLLISAGGVLFNVATFLIIYVVLQCMAGEGGVFWWKLMVLSLILAVLNILPIYPLDGGSILFSLYEIVTGKKPSPGFTNVCGWIGFVFIVLFFWVFPEWLGGLLDGVFRLVFGR